MTQFEWKEPLLDEEKAALQDYKDFCYSTVNSALRKSDFSRGTQDKIDRLDGAIKKGRCTDAVTLYRATGKSYLTIEGDTIKAEPGFSSTSLDYKCLGKFFEPVPVLLIIECPQHTAMAAFECDSDGGDEQERLLPRGIKFRIISEPRTVENRLDVLNEEGPFNHHYTQLGQTFIQVYTVEPILPPLCPV